MVNCSSRIVVAAIKYQWAIAASDLQSQILNLLPFDRTAHLTGMVVYVARMVVCAARMVVCVIKYQQIIPEYNLHHAMNKIHTRV
jgi:hypothetical protein